MTLNCQLVGFDIDKFNKYHCSWGHEKYSWHSYNGLMTANVKTNQFLVLNTSSLWMVPYVQANDTYWKIRS